MQAPAPERSMGLARVACDIRDELRRADKLPPGEMSFSLRRTHRFQRETLQMLLAFYERYGPIYSFRSLHRPVVALIGPEANHFVTVSGAENFSWRKGMFGEQLIPLIGDGLITTDWEYHDRARRIMMPAFHRRRLDAAVDVMVAEATRSLHEWSAGDTVDFYEWARDLAMAIAMRALLGLDPHSGGLGHQAAVAFERALAFYDTETWMMLLRGPGSPWGRMQANRRALDKIILGQIEARRRTPTGGDDILSMLLEARDEPDDSGDGRARGVGCRAGGGPEGDGFTAQELRDQMMHLLFGGHDTTSSTLSFLIYELGRNPHVLARVVAEQDEVLAGRAPTVEELLNELPYLSMVVDETLRLYPPVWFGPRMSVKPFEFAGHQVPAGVHIIHSSWVTHRLPGVFENPEAYIPERFEPEARRRLPPGAYMPFGGGQRICIGKRFGQLVVKAVATTVLQRFRCELRPGYELKVGKLPTLSPEGGLPVRVGARQGDRPRATVPS
ncbi:MAG TPA: cytochrome P450 [Solirubrobacteraceae bacterium]|jgi:cytochrome P450|nr:cytochrome P450 [Solirubrobacteraceae bacterium]